MAKRATAAAATVDPELAEPGEPADPPPAERVEPAPATEPARVEPATEPAPAPVREAVRENPLPPPPPPPVPEAKRGRGRPPGVKNRPKDGAQLAAPAPAGPPPLPSDPMELERTIAVFKAQAIPYVETVNTICVNVPPGMELQPVERDGLTTSIALVLHKYGGAIDPWIGLAMMLAAIGVPRYLVARELAKRAKGDPDRKPSDPIPASAPATATA